MIEDQLDKLRKQYIKTSPASHLIDQSWQNLSGELTSQNQSSPLPATRILIFVLAIILTTSGLVGAAQAAKPGNVLYPLELILDEIASNITGKEEIKIEKRAQEVIESVESSQKQQEEAIIQYQKTLEDTKEEAQQSGRQQEFRQTLEKQEEKFQDAATKNPGAQEKLQEVIKQTQRAKEEVKGQKDENKSDRGNSEEHRQNRDNQEEDNQRQDKKGNSEGVNRSNKK